MYIRAAHHRSAAPPACTRRTRWGSCPPERHPVGAAPAQPLTPPQGRRRRRRREHHWRHAGAAVGACVIRMIGASARPPRHDLFHTLACSLAPLLVRLRARPLARSQERLFMRDITIISSKRRTEPSSQHDRAPGIRARRQGEGRESTREENNIAPHYTSQERNTALNRKKVILHVRTCAASRLLWDPRVRVRRVRAAVSHRRRPAAAPWDQLALHPRHRAGARSCTRPRPAVRRA